MNVEKRKRKRRHLCGLKIGRPPSQQPADKLKNQKHDRKTPCHSQKPRNVSFCVVDNNENFYTPSYVCKRSQEGAKEGEMFIMHTRN